MIELYHWEPNGACARVLICLQEKGIDFVSHYVDLLAFEQFRPEILALHETGQVPILVHDGQVFTEASYIDEYLDEAFPDVPLMPAETLRRWEVRAWQKFVDDYLAASVSELAWQAYGLPAIKHRPDAAATVDRIQLKERRDAWTQALSGFTDDQLARSRGRAEEAVKKMEIDLQRGWLAGDTYTLADIALFPYIAVLPRVTPEIVNPTATPLTIGWLAKMHDRPSVQATLAMAKTPDPFGVAAPGPEQVRWG